MNTPIDKPRSRKLRFSVRALMIIVLIVGGGLGWKVRRARIQARAVAVVKAAGGFVRYDYEFPWVNGPNAREPSAPKWLRKFLGDEYFQEVKHVNFNKAEPPVTEKSLAVLEAFTDLDSFSIRYSSKIGDGLKHLRGFQKFKRLRLSGPGITDEGLLYLAGMSELEELTLSSSDKVTDVSVIPLVKSPKLQSLTLWRMPNLTDRVLESLPENCRLEKLSMSQTGIADAGLIALKKAPELKKLSLEVSKVTDLGLRALGGHEWLETIALSGKGKIEDGLACVQRLPRLKHIDLGDSKVTDKGITYLNGNPTLESIMLHNTGVSDAALEPIGNLANLRALSLANTKVTDAGLTHLVACRKLIRLYIPDLPGITDASAETISKIPTLESLLVYKTGLTDASIPNLAKLEKLSSLYLSGTKITKKGASSLQQALPALKINFAPISVFKPKPPPE